MDKELSYAWKEKAIVILIDMYNVLRDAANDFNMFNTEICFVKNCIIEYVTEVLKLTDSIIILVREGRIDTSLILVRALFEVSLQLCYLINDKKTMEEKAAFYLVVNNLKKYHYNKILIKNLKELEIDRDLYKEMNKNKEIINSLKENKKLIIKEVFEYIENCYSNVDKINWNNEKWFKIFSNKHRNPINNFKNLSKIVGFYDVVGDKKVLIYDSLYDLLSQQAHGIAAVDNMIFINNKQKFRNFDCLQQGHLLLKIVYILFIKIIENMVKTYNKEFRISVDNIVEIGKRLNNLKSDYERMYLEKYE